MSTPANHGPVANFFIFIWDGMNFTRRLVFNLLFFGFLLFLAIGFVAAMFSGGPQGARYGDGTTLVLAPEGELVEQYTTDPTTRALAEAVGEHTQQVQLRDLLRVIDAAKDDKKIERILLRVDRLQPSGYASLREVADALARFRASGKQIVAFGENMEQSQYLLAAQANEIYIDPMGGLLLEGIGRYRQFYREGLQDKLGVDVHLFKVGEYKSAAEPYVLDAASPESKEADLFWMSDIWQRYLADVAKARKLKVEDLAASFQTMSADIAAAQGDLGQYALKRKLVDGLKTEEQVEDLITERSGAGDSEDGYPAIGFGGYLMHLNSQLPILGDNGDVAVVVAEGEIVQGEQPPGTVGGESTAALLRDVRDDDGIKAVVLRVNSPGGDVFASEQIRREVEALKKAGKPVVVSMGDVAASGGYWISMNADRIYADPSTITGSIGIFGLVPTFPRALEKIGVHTDGVATTPMAGFSLGRPLQDDYKVVIQSVIEKGYRDFTGRVSKARKKPVADVDAVARGRVWTGAQAKERGLVDEFGGLQTAILNAAERAKLGKPGDYRVRYIEEQMNPIARFISGFAGSAMGQRMLSESGIAQAFVAKHMPQMHQDLKLLENAMQARGSAPVSAVAYCFCGF
ncbi:MAG: signal peptide peptidase SppA [Lysobacter sp.]|nr:MAG: signal peptide peptidase SppA [Lysobacter sp.]